MPLTKIANKTLGSIITQFIFVLDKDLGQMKHIWMRSPGYLIRFIKPETVRYVCGRVIYYVYMNLSKFNTYNLNCIVSSLLRCISREKAKKFHFQPVEEQKIKTAPSGLCASRLRSH